MKMAAQILERVMETAVNLIEPGVREGDVAAEVHRAMIAGTPEFTGDYSAIIPIMPSGRRTTTAPLSRTVVTGKPSLELAEISKTVINGLNTVMEFIRPGIQAQDIEAKWRESIAGSRVRFKRVPGFTVKKALASDGFWCMTRTRPCWLPV